MSYDLYVELDGESENDVNALVSGKHRGQEIDMPTRVRLLAGISARGPKDYTVGGDRGRGGYKSLVHNAKQPAQAGYAQYILQQVPLNRLFLPTAPDLTILPLGSWFLHFTFTLAKPYISKDDDPFYVAESVNPVRKDKVFKVPMMAASSWKGLLRWTAMQVWLVEKKGSLSDEEFARQRFALTLLFGDEKGEEPGQTKEFAGFLDHKLRPAARTHYEKLVRERFGADANEGLPHHAGRLMCYPTFFNLIDVEVINPHSRKTKAGTHPIYLECVPADAQGTFSLLYVPFDLIGQSDVDIPAQARADLQIIAEAVKAMMLTYGFSAKRTSGYGAARDEITGVVKTRIDEHPFERITFERLVQEVANVPF